MGDPEQSLLYDQRDPEAEGRLELCSRVPPRGGAGPSQKVLLGVLQPLQDQPCLARPSVHPGAPRLQPPAGAGHPVPSSRILQLAKPRAPATLLAEWDPVPKPKRHVSDYSRLLHLAMPKAQSEKCVPDRNPRWEVLDVTKKAVASPRIISLAKPKERRDANEGHNPYHISPASLTARASPRLQELATPKTITKKV
uniref:Theg spermatid protein n=1 Tax=Rousettus aegyptiacus TaxID=9407 RepID=A0A7J8BVH6_ROUAE|nr:theg spermatid protein [Rousettus aegyptiacus]